jgi:hypothetical protein
MPSLATLEAFAAMVEANDHVGAILKFYAPDARTRENDGPLRIGRQAGRTGARRACRSCRRQDHAGSRATSRG